MLTFKKKVSVQSPVTDMLLPLINKSAITKTATTMVMPARIVTNTCSLLSPLGRRSRNILVMM